MNFILNNSSSIQSILVIFHVVSALLSQIIVLMITMCAGLFLLKRRLIKRHVFSAVLQAIPAIDYLDQKLGSSISSGTFLISMATFSGIFLSYQPEYTLYPQEKFWWALSVWAWYSVVFLVKKKYIVPTRLIAQMSFVGFALVSSTLFGWIFIGFNE